MPEQGIFPNRVVTLEPDYNKFDSVDGSIGMGTWFILVATGTTYIHIHDVNGARPIQAQLTALEHEQITVEDQTTFLGDATAAISDKNNPHYINAIHYDGKLHNPSSSSVESAYPSNQYLNEQFNDYRASSTLSKELDAVVKAKNPAQASTILKAESTRLKARDRALTPQINQLQHKLEANLSDRILLGADVATPVLLGILTAIASKRIRNKRQRARAQKLQDDAVAYMTYGMDGEPEDILKNSPPGSTSNP